jgi:hypothetical protein
VFASQNAVCSNPLVMDAAGAAAAGVSDLAWMDDTAIAMTITTATVTAAIIDQLSAYRPGCATCIIVTFPSPALPALRLFCMQHLPGGRESPRSFHRQTGHSEEAVTCAVDCSADLWAPPVSTPENRPGTMTIPGLQMRCVEEHLVCD